MKRIMWQILQLLLLKLLLPPLPPPKKWMNLISDQLSTASKKYLKYLGDFKMDKIKW